ncbi:MAG: hydrogenase maturation protease [Chloroflexota bacterium]|nr:hydrogenase maturation protease [Chloroflexota bacterium]
MRSLIVGFGNPLRGDDGVGLAALRALEAGPLPDGVHCADVGIGGMALVHELQAGWDRLVIIDAVQRGGMAGTIYVLSPTLPDLAGLGVDAKRELLVDAHMAEPYSAMVLADALGVLPREIHVVGVEAPNTEELTLELSAAVQRAVPQAARRALELATATVAV